MAVVLDLGPKPLDVHVDKPAIAQIRISPYQLEKLVACQHLARMTRQLVKEAKLSHGKRNLVIPPAYM